MKDDKYRTIFSDNLKKYMQTCEKTQIDLINDLHLDKSTVSTWVNGTRLPRMDKVQMLADYFGILKSDLIEDKEAAAVPSAPSYLSDRDRRLVDLYHQMNEEGKDKLDERAEELIRMEYTVEAEAKKDRSASA